MERNKDGAADKRRDESFNSITGLNGSGKSNILDSICFVLGITNMSTVRAQNLQVRPDPDLLLAHAVPGSDLSRDTRI